MDEIASEVTLEAAENKFHFFFVLNLEFCLKYMIIQIFTNIPVTYQQRERSKSLVLTKRKIISFFWLFRHCTINLLRAWCTDTVINYRTYFKVERIHLRLATAKNNDSSRICTLYTSLWHALNLPIPLCIHQSLGSGLLRQTFPFLWVLEMFPCLSHRRFLLTNSQKQQQQLLLLLLHSFNRRLPT
jgi:hypothetical protein